MDQADLLQATNQSVVFVDSRFFGSSLFVISWPKQLVVAMTVYQDSYVELYPSKTFAHSLCLIPTDIVVGTATCFLVFLSEHRNFVVFLCIVLLLCKITIAVANPSIRQNEKTFIVDRLVIALDQIACYRF